MKNLQELLKLSHDTTVTGIDENGTVVFLKSYKYSEQKEEAQSDVQKLMDSGLNWRLGDIKHLTIDSIYKEALEFLNEISNDKYLVGELESSGYDLKKLLNRKDWRL